MLSTLEKKSQLSSRGSEAPGMIRACAHPRKGKGNNWLAEDMYICSLYFKLNLTVKHYSWKSPGVAQNVGVQFGLRKYRVHGPLPRNESEQAWNGQMPGISKWEVRPPLPWSLTCRLSWGTSQTLYWATPLLRWWRNTSQWGVKVGIKNVAWWAVSQEEAAPSGWGSRWCLNDSWCWSWPVCS